ncbi:DEKNAAC101381 [Brettanomyces naardenensis]|uniref:Alternative oxidase n=1 Tax=Brettanomyces naardenensis TaxID=13370 RepID=A0A448YHV3_BRENA|nr:DEKNAAC101381 [Brettanomyces naardenensis]
MLSTATHNQLGIFTPALSKALLTSSRYGLRFVSTVQAQKSSDVLSSSSPALDMSGNLGDHLPEARNTHMVKMNNPDEVKEGKFLTPAAFPHPGFVKADMYAVHYEHRKCQKTMDYITYYFMRSLRNTFDFFTGYIEPKSIQHQIEIANGPDRMTKEKWMTRLVVLESIAGIPGSVAGFLRHLRALRLFRRDNGFIETLLDEAYNERMHLLTFLKLAKPGRFARVMLYVGQGVFANLFFIVYVLKPAMCHRFVGYLEEEAVLTYTRCLEDMKLGLNPELYHTPVPQIAKDYWHLDDKATFYDLIQYIRADEAKHREVNHTFANLKIRGSDRNPFALTVDSPKPQPHTTLKDHHGTGWERKDLIL